jgi:hypothetical protein
MMYQGTEQLIQSFVADLLEERHEFPPEAEEWYRTQAELTGRLEDRIRAALLENLPEEDLPELERLLDEGKAESLQAFFLRHIPNIEDVIVHELEEFRTEYLAAPAASRMTVPEHA